MHSRAPAFESDGTNRPLVPLKAAGAVLVVIAYVAIAFRVGEQFPFARFNMWASTVPTSDRVLVLAEDGRVLDPEQLTGFDCRPAARAISHPFCVDGSNVADQDLRWLGWVATHRAQPVRPERYRLVKRHFAVKTKRGPIETVDCPIYDCTADRL